MRKALLILSVLFALPSFAQQSNVQLSVFVANPSYGWTERNGSTTGGSLGAALEYRWNQQWALELQVTSEKRVSRITQIDANGTLTFREGEETWHPLDLVAHYRFPTTSRWKPFVGAGLRYEEPPLARFGARTALEIDGGVHFMITPSLSLRLDAKQVLFDDKGNFDAGVRPSIGLGWRF